MQLLKVTESHSSPCVGTGHCSAVWKEGLGGRTVCHTGHSSSVQLENQVRVALMPRTQWIKALPSSTLWSISCFSSKERLIVQGYFLSFLCAPPLQRTARTTYWNRLLEPASLKKNDLPLTPSSSQLLEVGVPGSVPHPCSCAQCPCLVRPVFGRRHPQPLAYSFSSTAISELWGCDVDVLF